MLTFIVSTAVLVLINLVTDHEAKLEGFNELKGGARLGS